MSIDVERINRIHENDTSFSSTEEASCFSDEEYSLSEEEIDFSLLEDSGLSENDNRIISEEELLGQLGEDTFDMLDVMFCLQKYISYTTMDQCGDHYKLKDRCNDNRVRVKTKIEKAVKTRQLRTRVYTGSPRPYPTKQD
eukprot:TRINITY_DN4746_c0_g1_i1.p1 TRINITY_DN4746_c0_g1~~TRINITY_DN4746_c0_g1_i1.p1  ORF type:complete len:140 (+),score=27.14 TRINITY_DN4746_c0_g1_i1:192-611(+)